MNKKDIPEDMLDYQYYCQECGHLRDYCDCDVGVD